MAGMGSLIGGDTTFDLSRLLRHPETSNRKDQRNGRKPTPCYIHSIDPSKRYTFDDFAKYAALSPAKKRRETVATVKLPAAKKLTAKRKDKLSEYVLECSIATDRSAADWALVCWAIEHGVDKEAVWSEVNHIGKFADRGREYFETTWAKAASCTQEKIYKGAEKRVGKSDADVDDEGEEDGPDRLSTAEISDAICTDEHFAQDGGGKLYYFHNGRYCARGAEHVRGLVKKHLRKIKRQDDWSTRLAAEVVEYIRVDSPMLWDAPPDDVLCVENGLLDVTTRELKPHSPEYLSPVQLPVKYDPAATGTKIAKFIGEVFPEDNQTLAYEIVAFAMLPDISIQKAVLLVGEDGNGKSRYLMMLSAFLGRQNVSGVSLHQIESDKFAAARLYGKLVNICPDLPSEHLAGTSKFKAIVGGDLISGEEKYYSSFEFKVFSKLLFSANNPPRANDASEGFFDRWLVAKCGRRFRGEVGVEIAAKVLDAMLSEPAELSWLLNKALDVLPALRKRGRFTESDSTRAAFEEFHATTDPLAVWLDGATTSEPDNKVLKDSLHAAFCRYTAKKGLASMTKQAFAMKLKKLRPDIDEGQRTMNGKERQHVWLGIGLRSEQRLESTPQTHESNGGLYPSRR
jgi:P4 family phage/plasmid primase-like protien